MKLKTQERASLEMVLLSCQGRQVSIKEMSLLWEHLLVVLCGDLLTRQNQTGRQERREKWRQSKLEKMTEEKPTKAAKRSREETEVGNKGCCCGSVAQSCPALCGPMDGSTPGFPVLHHLPKLAQSHVH